MYNLAFSGTEVLLGGGLLVLCLGLLFLFFKHYINQKTTTTNMESNRTKYLYADVFRHRSTLLRVGLISALAFILMAFNWTQYDYTQALSGGIDIEVIDIEIIPMTVQPPPPPPPPPLKPIIEMVIDDKIEESETFESMDINASDAVIPPAFTLEKIAKNPLPPPIETEAPTIFKIVERMPVFGECADGEDEAIRRKCSNKALIEFIGEHIHYPSMAAEVGIQGTVVLRFVVEKNGSMTNLEIIRDMGGGLGKEAVRVAHLMAETDGWTAGQQRGRSVRVQFNLPVKFKLQ